MARKKAASTEVVDDTESTEEAVSTASETSEETTTEETTTEDATTEETTTEETVTEETVTEETVTEETTEETVEETDTSVVQMVYIGPTIPRARLTNGGIVRGTQEEVTEYIASVTAKYTKAKYLFVTTDKLAESKKKVKTKGNILNKYYRDVLDQARTRT